MRLKQVRQHPFYLFLKARGADRFLLAVLITAVSAPFVPDRAITVVFRTDVMVQVGALVIAAPAAICGLGMEAPPPGLEPRQSTTAFRAIWLLIVLLICGPLLALAHAPFQGLGIIAPATRNACLLISVAVITARFAGTRASWLPGLALVFLTWLQGTFDLDARAAGWALLLQPISSWPSLLVAGAGLAGAFVVYPRFDVRPD